MSQGQRLVGSEDRVETNGRQTDGGDYITSHVNAVGNKCLTLLAGDNVQDSAKTSHNRNCCYSVMAEYCMENGLQ